MKKFTLFCAAALAVLTATAQTPFRFTLGEKTVAPVSGKTYALRTNNQNGSKHFLNAYGGVKQNDLVTQGEGAPKFIWTLTQVGENWTMQNRSTGRYLKVSGTTNGGAVEMVDEPAEITISVSDDGTNTALKNPEADQWIDAGANGSATTTWEAGVAGSRVIDIMEATVWTELMINYDAALTQANTAYNGLQSVGDNLITSVDQLSSPYTEPNEGALANLIDNENTTFWHSAWSTGNVDNGVHYLQIALPEETLGDIQLTYVRRNASGDQLTQVKIVGVNGEETEDVATLSLPFNAGGETVKAYFNLAKTYEAIRLVELATAGDHANRGFWHAAELQLNKVEFNRTLVPDAAAALKEQIDAAVEPVTVTEAQYTALTDALAAYNAALAAIPADFTVTVNGPEGAGIVCGGQTYGAGTASLPSNTTEADLAAAAIEGYDTQLTLVGHAITVTYKYAYPVALTEGDIILQAAKKATTIDATTDAADNSHWYIVEQSRDGVSPMYDNGANTLKRAAAGFRADSLSVEDGAKYLVRFIATATDGVYNVQFATGRFITANLTTGNAFAAADYFVYTTNDEGSVAWNLTTDGETYGGKVDNNGAGSTLSFWESGKITATEGNNIWAIYPVTFTAPIATAIEDVQKATAHRIYDLTGRQIATLRKGVNIVDGRKIVVK